jgi:hypothetical protein
MPFQVMTCLLMPAAARSVSAVAYPSSSSLMAPSYASLHERNQPVESTPLPPFPLPSRRIIHCAAGAGRTHDSHTPSKSAAGSSTCEYACTACPPPSASPPPLPPPVRPGEHGSVTVASTGRR